MKNRIITLSLREIKSSYKRFLSLMLMSFLGVAVFIGMRSANKVMMSSLDKYYDINNVYDIKIVSTLGLTDSDIKALDKLDSTDKVIGIHSKDVYFIHGDKTEVIKITEYNYDINKVILHEGRMPLYKDEIVVEYTFLDRNNLKLNDYIDIKDEDNVVTSNKLKIVGTVTSPLYILNSSPSNNRGSTTLGNGEVIFYAYGNKYLFNMDYYSEIAITVKNAKEELLNEKEYRKLINNSLEEIDSIKSDQEKERYNAIYTKLSKEIDKNEKLGKNKLNKAKSELDIFKSELDIGNAKLIKGKKDLEKAKKEFDSANKKLVSSRKEIKSAEEKLNKAKQELEKAENEINSKLSKYNLDLEDVITLKKILYGNEVSKESLKKIVKEQAPTYYSDISNVIDYLYDNNFYSRIKELINKGTDSAKELVIEVIPKNINNYDEVVNYIRELNINTIKGRVIKRLIDTNSIREIKKVIPKNTKHYDKIINYIDKYCSTVDNIKLLFDNVTKIDNSKKEVASKEKELNSAKKALSEAERSLNNYRKQIEKAERTLKSGQKEYNSNLKKYNSYIDSYLRNKRSFEKQIADARKDISSLSIATWYVDERLDNSDYSGFMNIEDSLTNLARAFPTVFFIVAIFMSVMSMSRMALEDREEIGSLKAMGFSNKHIIMKYVIYSLIATIIGGLLGSIFGFYFITWFVWNIYGILYRILEFNYYYDFNYMIIGIIISIICITGVSILTVTSILREKPSELLRPKSPGIGKKIIFEYLPFWNKINFSNKVTIRNICRYKKRVIMTVIGIVGCTVLMITGFGIKDSITGIAGKQFSESMVYDALVYLNEDSYDYDKDKVFTNKHIKYKMDGRIEQVEVGNMSGVVFHTIENVSSMNDIVKGKSTLTHKMVTLENDKVVITDKLARMNSIKVGDKIKFKMVNNKTYEFVVSDIFENYVGNHMFINKETYEKYINTYKRNVTHIKIDDKDNIDEVNEELLKNDIVLSIQSLNSILVSVDNMLVSLDKVVILLIVLSGALSFVVLYNLSYINISERRREIATLKVLGFYNGEVDNYIIKENFIITLIGIIIGIILSKFFVDFIVDSIEINLVKFIHNINLISYILSFIFMILFTTIVSIIIHFALKKINMIESLKSVE